jgi:hypothetical protein
MMPRKQLSLFENVKLDKPLGMVTRGSLRGCLETRLPGLERGIWQRI